jgi:gluconate 2-dehydrogenase gamma chain
MPRALSRRALLLASTALAGIASEPHIGEGRTISGEVPWSPGTADAPSLFAQGELKFFTREEAAFMDAVLARLIPADDLGPGAREAGVTVFLDRQLAGSYGRGDTWYMDGPWHDGSKSQGYQSHLTPAQLYRAAIKSIDAHCREKYSGKAFRELSTDQQDAVLTDLEKGHLKLQGVGEHSLGVEGTKGDTFFATLLQNTAEGFFCDPIYGGNRDMIGWKLIGFPGARYDYRPYVKRHGEKIDLAPVGILGRPDWHSDNS